MGDEMPRDYLTGGLCSSRIRARWGRFAVAGSVGVCPDAVPARGVRPTMPTFLNGVPQGYCLLLPVLLAELIQALCEYYIYRDPGPVTTDHALARRKAAGLMSTVRLPGRIGLCCVGIGLSLAVCIEQPRLFPHSAFFAAADEQKGYMFAWLTAIFLLTALCAVLNRNAFSEEHRLKSFVFLYGAGVGTYEGDLRRAGRWPRLALRAVSVWIGWSIIYGALLLALVQRAP
jgi:hypothetical protein